MANHMVEQAMLNLTSRIWFNVQTELFRLKQETVLVIPWQAPMQVAKHMNSHQAVVETMQWPFWLKQWFTSQQITLVKFT